MSNIESTLIENPRIRKGIETAHNLPDAANADNSIQGYAAINAVDEHSEIAALAYELYKQRGEHEGDADGDWFRAEQEVRRRREANLA
jgi:hypothetical protein